MKFQNQLRFLKCILVPFSGRINIQLAIKIGQPTIKVEEPSFAIDLDHRLFENGYFRLRRGLRITLMDWKRVNRYSNPTAKCGRIFEDQGKWYMTLVFEVDAVECQMDGQGLPCSQKYILTIKYA